MNRDAAFSMTSFVWWAQALGGADLSWLVGILVGATLYVALTGRAVRADSAGDLSTTDQAASVTATATFTGGIL